MSTKQRPKQQRGEVTVELLLDAALRVYAAEGEQGFTVSAVTKASGVSLGSLYHHFGSLDGLLSALAQRWLDRLLGELTTALAGSRTARSGIRAIVRTYLAFVRDHRDAARLLPREARLPAFAHWIQPRIEAGELAPLPLPLVESLVLGPVIGAARRSLSGVDDVDLDEAARLLPDRIWRSLSP
ncbi:TetR/AcrR family transcriptional regulator [Streptomyces sp. NPDC002143]